jgi:RNA polymerase sigma-70 factor (ECF subfamily)
VVSRPCARIRRLPEERATVVAEDPEHAARSAHQEGDSHATLGLLVRAYGQALRRYCFHLLKDEELADDVYQTVLMQALADLPTFSSRSSFRVWLYAIARYRCMDVLKVSRSRGRYMVQHEEDQDAPVVQDTPEEHLMRHARYVELQQALQQLPLKSREALVQRYFEQRSYEEMSRLGGEQAATLRVRVARALRQLRDVLE